QDELPTAGLDVHLSLDYAQNPSAVFMGLDMKLGASDGCDCSLVAQLHLTWFVTVENVEKSRQGIHGHPFFLFRHQDVRLGADFDRRAVGEADRGARVPASAKAEQKKG